MSLTDDTIWALRQSESMADLHDLWVNVWRLWADRAKRRPPPEVEAVKNERKRLHDGAELDELLSELRGALFELKRYADTPGWVNGVGWGTLAKAKKQGAAFTLDARTEKQIRAVIRMAEPEEDIIE